MTTNFTDKLANTKKEILIEYEVIFSEVQVFQTDNFEDPEHINHPCYNHYGALKAFEEFLKDSLDIISKVAKEEVIALGQKYKNSAAPIVKFEIIAGRILEEELNWNPEQNDAHLRIAVEIWKWEKGRWQEFLDNLAKELDK